jgi:hypothetical protein
MKQSKTVWAAVISLVGAIAAVCTGDASLPEGLQIGVTAILSIFLRHSLAKTSASAEAAQAAAISAESAVKVAKGAKKIGR